MNEPEATPAIEESQAHGEVDSVDVRAEQLMTQLMNDPSRFGDDDEEAAVEGESEAEAAAGEELSKPKVRAEEEPAKKDERSEALKRAAELERQNVRAASKLAERENRVAGAERQLQEAYTRVQSLEAKFTEQNKVFDDPHALLQLLSERVPAERLADWMVQATKPEIRAEWAAKKAASAVHPEFEAMKQRMLAIERERQEERAFVGRQAAEQEAVAHLKTVAGKYPYAAALADKKPREFARMLHTAADVLKSRGDEVSYESVAHYLNNDIEEYAKVFLPQSSGEDTQAEPAPVAKARTLTTRNSAGRSSLLSDEDAALSLDERAEQLKRLARRPQ